MDLSILPECYVDTNLIETIVPPVKRGKQQGYNHQKGCGTVALVMQRDLANSFALGIIDKDKQTVDYLQEFDEVITTPSLILHKHKTRPHYIIQICPAMERFIVANAMAVSISLADHGLPVDFERLKKVSKTANSKDDIRFKQLFKMLYQQGAPGIVKLAAWVKHLKENNYQADIEVLKELINKMYSLQKETVK